MKYNPKIHHRRSIRLQGYDYSQAGAYFITICCDNRALRFGTIAEANQNNSDVQMALNEFGQIAHDEWTKLPERFPNMDLDVFQIMPNHVHGIIVLNNVGATLAVAQNNMGIDDVGATLAVAQNNMGIDDVGATLAVAQNNMGIDDVGATLAVAQNNMDIDDVGATLAVAQNNMGIDDVGATLAVAQNDNPIIGKRAGASPAPTGNKIVTIGNIVGAYKSLVANGCLGLFKQAIEIGDVHEYEMMGKLWQRNYHEHIIRDVQAYQKISDYIINNPANWKEDQFFTNK